MPTRDSRAEARKAWRQIRTYLPLRDREHFKRAILLILTDLARREYEAGYRDGMQDRVNAQAAEEGRNARRRG